MRRKRSRPRRRGHLCHPPTARCIAKADFSDEVVSRTVVDMIRGMLQDAETPMALLEDAMACMQSAATRRSTSAQLLR